MAFAAHTNTDYGHGKDVPLILGQFRESEHGQFFEYAARPEGFGGDFAPDARHLVYVSGGGVFRFARVLKTVAYVVVGEEENETPIEERWSIKLHNRYPTDWAEADRAKALARKEALGDAA